MLMTKEQFKKELTEILDKEYEVKPSNASNELIYKATAEVVKNLLREQHKKFISDKTSHRNKKV